jgi:hypothetical protein
MSADNWTFCPKCKDSKNKELESLYGKIPAEEYLKKAKELSTESNEETLREDYEIGIWDGKFRISYDAYCEACGYEYTFECEKDLEELDESTQVSRKNC